MTTITAYEPGTFCWVDVQTTDQEAAKAFYAELFGWSTEDAPIDENTSYTMCKVDGQDVCAIAPLPAEQAHMGVPSHWNSYVSVSDANETAEKAKSLGADLLMEPFDVMDAGRMAVIQDPTGAVFMAWEPKAHAGASIANQPGSLAWNELTTRDTDAAQSFYTQLFGWQANSAPIGDTGMEYTSFMDGETPRAGVMQMPEQLPAEIPASWMVYFAVANADEATEKAKSLGATVQVEPTDIPTVGRFAVITDPQGATFAVIRLQNPPA